jgi:STE24 endopeptidase
VRLLRPPTPSIAPARIDARTYFTAEEIDRGAKFARPQLALGLARGAVELAGLIAINRRLPRRLRSQPDHAALSGAAVAAGATLVLTVAPLPLTVVARRRAIAVGLVTQSWGGWAIDLVKASLIQTVVTGAGGALAVVTMRRYPRQWWGPAAAGSVVVGAGFAALAPVLLDPIFNKFTPLPDSQTRSDVLQLARGAGVRVGEVYSVDASRRTTAANAYVTGLGPTKRVVLFDTLLDRYSQDEVRLVVAHELAHVRHRDVPRGVAYAAAVAPFGALAVQRLSWMLSAERDTAAALPAVALAAALVSTPIGVIANRLSRAVERRADEFSLRLAGAPDAFISFERRIALQNVADVDAPRWITTLLSTHPPTTERIGAAVAWSEMNRRSA